MLRLSLSRSWISTNLKLIPGLCRCIDLVVLTQTTNWFRHQKKRWWICGFHMVSSWDNHWFQHTEFRSGQPADSQEVSWSCSLFCAPAFDGSTNERRRCRHVLEGTQPPKNQAEEAAPHMPWDTLGIAASSAGELQGIAATCYKYAPI